MTFRKQAIIAGDETKADVILATKQKDKAKDFIIPIIYFPVAFLLYIVCCNTSTLSFFILISFLYEDFFKASKEQVTINKWYIKIDILVKILREDTLQQVILKRQMEVRCNSIFPQTEPTLSKAEATHPLKLHLGI